MLGRDAARTVALTHARVLAVDDHVPFLALLRDVIASTGHLEMVGEAQSGEDAVAAARKLRPDMVLMDVHMPGLGGLAAAERIKADSPSTLVVLISTTHPDDLPPRGSRVGADAIVWKSRLGPRLLDEIWQKHTDPD